MAMTDENTIWRNPAFLASLLDPAQAGMERGGIPRFVGKHYAGSFGFEWARFSETQYDREPLPADFPDPGFISADRYAPGFDHEWRKNPWIADYDRDNRFETAMSFTIKTGFRPESLAGKTVLDAGCGSGRFLDVLAAAGAQAVGIDATQAVDSAARALAKRGRQDRVALAQASVDDLPFRTACFDFIYSIGVLHHTPSVENCIRSLARFLKPGGTLAVWLYHRSGSGRTLQRIWWHLLHNLPERALLPLLKPACALYPLYRLQPWGIPLRVLFPICMHPDPEVRLLGTFDSYSPRYSWFTPYPQGVGFMKRAGLEAVEVGPFPTSVRGRAPLERGGRVTS